jgi:hypothetical protein
MKLIHIWNGSNTTNDAPKAQQNLPSEEEIMEKLNLIVGFLAPLSKMCAPKVA